MKGGPTEWTDAELVALALAGRQSAYAEIMQRHKAPIYRLILGYVAHPDDALDLVQESFIAAYRNLEYFDPGRPLRAWLARIAINKCRDWARRRAVRRFLTFARPLDAAAAVADPAPAADRVAEDKEALATLWDAIAALPKALKEPLILRTFEGLSQAEVAALLGISEKAVETRLYRARARLAALRTT